MLEAAYTPDPRREEAPCRNRIEGTAAHGLGNRGAEQRRNLFLIVFLTVLLHHLAVAVAAGIAFDSSISSGMVIQRGKLVTLSGTGSPNTTLTITLASQCHTVPTTADGSWQVGLPAMAPGGPFILTATEGANTASVDDVWVGDGWLAAGQSNMQMGLAETIGGREVLAALSRQPSIRFLEVPRGGADSPQSELKAEWKKASPDRLARFSAVACHFAAHLRRDPALAAVPLGLINSSFGGTSIEAWSPADSLAEFPKDQLSGSMFGIPPGSLFNRMIFPLLAHPIKGVLWYQGEANAGQPALYEQLLRNLMEQWRLGWRQADLPFLVVQLPAFEGRMGNLDFGWLREAQDKACTRAPSAWSAVTYDTTSGFDLHPREKEEIGRRLALLAQREVYGLAVHAHGPRPRKVESTGRRLVVTFDQEVATALNEAPQGFAVAGADGDYLFAAATINGCTVSLESEHVPEPKTVRYAWGGLTRANLIGRHGLPAFPFRSDDFTPESVGFQPLPEFHRLDTPVYQLETGTNGRIASLIVRGKQFLSNQPPGGTAVPGGFGFRNLAHTTVLGPRRIALSDGGFTLEVACLESEMTWTMTNHGSEPVDLHINLSSAIQPLPQASSVTLSHDDVRIQLKGINRIEGHRIIATAPAQASTQLQFLIEKP